MECKLFKILTCHTRLIEEIDGYRDWRARFVDQFGPKLHTFLTLLGAYYIFELKIKLQENAKNI